MRKIWVVLGLFLLAGWLWFGGVKTSTPSVQNPLPTTPSAQQPMNAPVSQPNGSDGISVRALPPQAVDVLRDIARGGPYDYPRDGVVFQNRERILARQPKGYYREYTVKTPGSRDRGARRIVTGGRPVTEWYYTDDHYQSFKTILDAREITQ